jgi:hypothetical protein
MYVMLGKNNNENLIIPLVLFSLLRFLPLPINVTPIAAIALFAGTYILDKRKAFYFVIALVLLGDVLLSLLKFEEFGLYKLGVYLTLILVVRLGVLLRGREQRQTIMVASLVGSILFFFLANLTIWLFGNHGENGGQSLGKFYVDAIPFVKGTMMGDLFFNTLLFGGYSLIKWIKGSFITNEN